MHERRELEAAQEADRMKFGSWTKTAMPRAPKVVPETNMRSRESRIVWTRHRLNKGVVRWSPYQIEKARS
jgi:hypothetical protein